MNVSIIDVDDELVVSTPYVPEFPPAARKLGGRWQPADKTWVFDSRDKAAVQDLCRSLFGTAGVEDEGELVTVQVKLGELSDFFFEGADSRFPNRVRFCGRVLASRRGRDCEVELGHDVRLIAGRFEASAGSMKNPRLGEVDDIVLEVRDLPKVLFTPTDGVTVVSSAVDQDALLVEREQLLKRLAEIDALLGEQKAEVS